MKNRANAFVFSMSVPECHVNITLYMTLRQN